MDYIINPSDKSTFFSKSMDKFDPYVYLGLHKFKYTSDIHHKFYPALRISIGGLKNPVFVKI